MEYVVEPVEIRLVDVVGETISEIQSVASQENDRFPATIKLPELDVERARKLLFFIEVVVEQGNELPNRWPSTRRFLQVPSCGGAQVDVHCAGHSQQSAPDRTKLRCGDVVGLLLQRDEKCASRAAERQRFGHRVGVIRSKRAFSQCLQLFDFGWSQNGHETSEVPEKIADLFDEPVSIGRVGCRLPLRLLQFGEHAASFAEGLRLAGPGKKIGVLG